MDSLSSPPRTSIAPSSYSAIAPSFDARRQPRRKESSFVYKHGQRHHSFDAEKAPYPVSYDRHVLELESLDIQLNKSCRGSVSFMDFKEGPPRRSLDLGCGAGTWVLEAAAEWPECQFVGLDLVNVQMPLEYAERSVAERIVWMHGNFLTTKLPFDDDQFDHVHVQSIARGVPENKWGVLFEEINRVLRPGGAIEMLEDDILFPSLPRWFTEPLRTRVRTRRTQSMHIPDSANRPISPLAPGSPSDAPLHDHALLESLYRSIFESRFINLTPTAVLPSYFTTYFRQVTLGPVIHYLMPPLPPLQPLPQQIIKTYAVDTSLDGSDLRASTPQTTQSFPQTRPTSLSFSSLMSDTLSTSFISEPMSAPPSSHTSKKSRAEHTPETPDDTTPTNRSVITIDDPPAGASLSHVRSATQSPRYFTLDYSLTENSTVPPVVPIENLMNLSERSLAMHLYRSYQSVLACQEAMWEELKDRIRNKKDELNPYGWEDDEELEELQNRSKFERLIGRYRTDMQARVALWCSLTNIGWPLPPREPLSKAELIEEERVRESILEARRFSPLEEPVPCRAVRILVGYKKGEDI